MEVREGLHFEFFTPKLPNCYRPIPAVSRLPFMRGRRVF
jgi:hypothetical protein